MAGLLDRFRSGWNAFQSQETDPVTNYPVRGSLFTGSVNTRSDRPRLRTGNEKSILSSIYTRISVDVSMVEMRHTRHDDTGRYISDMDSGLNNCLKVEANIDQSAFSLMQDIVLMAFDKGAAAVVPVDTTINPNITGAYDIRTLRVGEIVEWLPQHVRVNLYNDKSGKKQVITLSKNMVGIIENPFYMIMNEPNSTFQRLIRKLSMLDSVDEASSSGKLDLIIQLPYVIRSDARKLDAQNRAKDIESQLRTNQYGIAYIDGTEKITQLNRPTENNLLEQIKILKTELFDQLGITPEILNGTASEAAMLNYIHRTVGPILEVIAQEMRRKFLTKTARAQGQWLDYFTDPFALIPMAQLAEIVDKLTRNEVVTSNEIRGKIGFKPSSDPKADQLINANMPVDDTGVAVPPSAAAGPAVPTAPSAPQAVPNPPPDAPRSPIEEFFMTNGVLMHSADADTNTHTPIKRLRRLGPLSKG